MSQGIDQLVKSETQVLVKDGGKQSIHMRSEYVKALEKARHTHGREGKKSLKKKEPGDEKERKKKVKEIEAEISEAEAMNICSLEPDRLAKELTATEIKIITDITPIEIIKFNCDSEESVCPTLVGYINFTKGLSFYVASSILESDKREQANTEKQRIKQQRFHGKGAKEVAQRYWVDVMKHLLQLNNRNSIDAIFKGLMKTSPPRIMQEEISDIFTEVSDRVSIETESALQASNKLYVRDVKSLEKHLIDASTNKTDRESPVKFKRIIEYLSYLRTHTEICPERAVNHALITTFRKERDTRPESTRNPEIFYKGCFLFLENSRFVPLEE